MYIIHVGERVKHKDFKYGFTNNVLLLRTLDDLTNFINAFEFKSETDYIDSENLKFKENLYSNLEKNNAVGSCPFGERLLTVYKLVIKNDVIRNTAPELSYVLHHKLIEQDFDYICSVYGKKYTASEFFDYDHRMEMSFNSESSLFTTRYFTKKAALEVECILNELMKDYFIEDFPYKSDQSDTLYFIDEILDCEGEKFALSYLLNGEKCLINSTKLNKIT